MRVCRFILLFAALLPAFGQQPAAAPAASAPALILPGKATAASVQPTPVLCSAQAGSKLPRCPTEDERRKAAGEFHEALKLQKHSKQAEAFMHFEQAAALAPDNLEYVTAREVARQKLVYEDLQIGNQAMAAGQTVTALGRFREALQFDPNNEFARQQLNASLPRTRPEGAVEEISSNTIQLQPEAGQRKFHLRGNTRDIISQVTLAYGITAVLDDSVANRPLRLDLEEATWPEAISVIRRLTKTLWTPLSARQILFAADTEENRRNMERMSYRTFYLPQASTPTALNEIVTGLRTLFDIRFVNVDPMAQTVTVRADSRMLNAVTQFLQGLQDRVPEVLFQIDVFTVTRDFTRAIGASIPTEFQVYNVPTELQSLSSSSSTQSLINELISSGLINQSSSTAIAALVAQLLGQQNSLLSQPFALFGGGMTLSALTIPATAYNFSRNESIVQDLQSITLRASQGTPAVMKIGERYPIMNAIYSPIYNTSAISAVLGNQSYQAPFPSFTFEDLGFNLKATPIIRHDNSVDLKLELQMRSLGGQSENGIPIINNREFTGNISARNGQSVLIAGNLTQSESDTLEGNPETGSVPGLGSRTTQETDDELLVVLTPHVVIDNPENGPEIFVPNETRSSR